MLNFKSGLHVHFFKTYGCSIRKSLYYLVDHQKIRDTQILHRLYTLGSEGNTCQGLDQSTLAACAQRYLGIVLPKDVTDATGDDVRTSWGKWKGRPLSEIPELYLDYLGKDVLCTFACWRRLSSAIFGLLNRAHEAWGFVDYGWLNRMMNKYGPQTHDLQVMAAVALEEIERVGFGLDLEKRDEIAASLQQHENALREQLRLQGYLAGEPGCQKALQAIIRAVLRENPDLHLATTEKTEDFSTKEKDLDKLAEVSEFFATFKEWKQASAMRTTFLSKMGANRIHPHYDLLKNTGRTSSINPNIQGFPRRKKKNASFNYDVRRCFVPGKGKLFYIADYASIELRTLSQAVLTQFRLESQMARAINQGTDVHRVVAARMKATTLPNRDEILANPQKFSQLLETVTTEERNAAKPANFGLPAGMGTTALKNYARAQYDQPYSDADAEGWRNAWLDSFPEMRTFREEKNIDFGQALARELSLTPEGLKQATRQPLAGTSSENEPQGWLGGMAMKVLQNTHPARNTGKAYSTEELDFLWNRLQLLGSRLEPEFAQDLRQRRPSRDLGFAVKRLLGEASVLTLTGRLRARTTYTSRRNTVFQGAAADGAKLALYRLWRAGFQVVAFIHDEVVVEVAADADLAAIKDKIDSVLVTSMNEICPDIRIDVEGAFYACWSKDNADLIEIDRCDANSSAPQPLRVPIG